MINCAIVTSSSSRYLAEARAVVALAVRAICRAEGLHFRAVLPAHEAAEPRDADAQRANTELARGIPADCTTADCSDAQGVNGCC